MTKEFKEQQLGIYGSSLALLNDLYQISMSYSYWKCGKHNDEAMFQMYFRKNPFEGGFAVTCGLDAAIEYISMLKFSEDDLAYLGTLKGRDQQRLVCDGFIDYLRHLKFTVNIDGIEEGRVVFAQEPLIRVTGPLLQCQLLETPLLNLINFPTLIATKAARICLAAGGDQVLEFGLRRAQGIDGGLMATRASYIGGVTATSDMLAGKMFGIPVRGTHAHSWVMSFDDELEAFQKFAEAMPGNSVLLVDTYNTLHGVENAIITAEMMRARGQKLAAIRLDSGDLAYLAREARKKLDAAGFEDVAIVASNDLDEHLISSLKLQGAPINIWGVGTKLVTGFDQPALGGVYKLVAIRKHRSDPWTYKLKLSEQLSKITTPGQQQVRRFFDKGRFMGDMIFDENIQSSIQTRVIVDPLDMTRRKVIPDAVPFEDLLVPIFREGKCIYQTQGIEAARTRCKKDLDMFHDGIKRLTNPHTYPVGLEKNLFERKAEMILKLRGFDSY